VQSAVRQRGKHSLDDLLIAMPPQQTDAGILVKTQMWQLTPSGLERVLADACSDGDIDVRGYWSLRVAVAFLMFLAGGGLDEA
jgi:hypothetical protein